SRTATSCRSASTSSPTWRAEVAVSDDTSTSAQDAPSGPAEQPRQAKSLTIGAVCKQLSQEFPDISISKIRYLEDQKLLAPRRTPGGARLYAQPEVSRLRPILRLERDGFLPLRGIRPGLAAGRTVDEDVPPPAAQTQGGAAGPGAPAAAPGDGRPGAALRRLT